MPISVLAKFDATKSNFGYTVPAALELSMACAVHFTFGFLMGSKYCKFLFFFGPIAIVRVFRFQISVLAKFDATRSKFGYTVGCFGD